MSGVGLDYAAFDAVALGLPLLLLATRPTARTALRDVAGPALAVAAAALAWTVPWDRHLVLHGVWSYAPGRVTATVGRLPVAELAFVVLEVLLVAAWGAGRRLLDPLPPAVPVDPAGRRLRPALLWAGAGVVGALLALAGGPVTYLGLLLAWIAPPLALQSAVAGDLLAGRRRERLLLAAPVALYLCVADRLALADGIWSISAATRTGFAVLGLPLEEGLFFALTGMLVADALLLARDPAALGRARRLLPARVRSRA